MTLEVRIVRSHEAALLGNVAPEVFDEGIDPNLLHEFLNDDRHHLAIALDEGRVVGFASGVHYVHPDKPSEMWINEVGVSPTHHRRGIGKAVVGALLDHARRLKCREAWVLTDRLNTAAMQLYASVGGEEHSPDQVMFSFDLER